MVKKHFIPLFLFILCSNNFASDSDVGTKERLLEVYKTLREVKKAGGFELEPIEEERDYDINFCVSCDVLSPLVSEVNKILSMVAEEEEKKDPTKRTVEIVSGLDAMYHYSYRKYESINQFDCDRYVDSYTKKYKKDIDLDSAIVMISQKIPLDKLNAVQIRDGKKRTYFYRGKGADNNIIIRIDVHDSESANITYYKIKEPPVITPKNKLTKSITNSKSRDKWEIWASSSDEEDVDIKNTKKLNEGTDSETPIDRMDYGIGFSIEHKDNIPKKLTLIKGKSFTSIADAFAIKTDTEVSTKKQEVSMSVSTVKGDDYAKFKLKENFYEVQIPTRISLLESGLKLSTMYSINSDKEQKVFLSLDGEEGTTTSLILQHDKYGQSATLNRVQQISESQKISFQIRSDDSGSSEGWVRYKLAF